MPCFQPQPAKQRPVRVNQQADLHLLSQRGISQKRRTFRAPRSPGFTLLELMIVVGIVGILSAIVFPQYRRAMATAEASSIVLETIAYSEHCAVAHKSGLAVMVAQPSGGATQFCNGLSTRQFDSRRWSGDATGVRCLGFTAVQSNRQVRLRVTVTGVVTCTFLN